MSTPRRARHDRRPAISRGASHPERGRSADDDVDDDVRALLQALDAAREKAKLTKAALAERVALPPETIRRLFTSGGQNPTAATLMKLARALGLRIALVRSGQRTTTR